ncbi:hypothetical protein RLIN73S_06059 [Rhodanobacter lindaniclasticus]
MCIIAERVGRAIRNPPRDVMLSHAAKNLGGYGWTFGIHEACDQFGAMFGPLVVAAVLAHHGSYHLAFAVLLVPALINLTFVLIARLLYPKPQDLEQGVLQAALAPDSPARSGSISPVRQWWRSGLRTSR